MPFRLGPLELVIILVIVLLIFGVGKLPQIGKSLGEGLKSFKQGVSEDGEEAAKEKEENKTEPKAEQSAAEAPKSETGAIDEPAKVSEEDLEAFKKWQAEQSGKTASKAK
jgi:sec-independent protein translocase protein TatA